MVGTRGPPWGWPFLGLQANPALGGSEAQRACKWEETLTELVPQVVLAAGVGGAGGSCRKGEEEGALWGTGLRRAWAADGEEGNSEPRLFFQDCSRFYTRARRKAVRQVEEKLARLQPGLHLFFEDLLVAAASVANITTIAHWHP